MTLLLILLKLLTRYITIGLGQKMMKETIQFLFRTHGQNSFTWVNYQELFGSKFME
jgi:hypothetical protein